MPGYKMPKPMKTKKEEKEVMKGVPHYDKDGKVTTGGSHKMPDGSLHSGKHIHLLVKNYFILKICRKVYKEELLC